MNPLIPASDYGAAARLHFTCLLLTGDGLLHQSRLMYRVRDLFGRGSLRSLGEALMKRSYLVAIAMFAVAAILAVGTEMRAQSALKISYGPNGLQQLSYGGLVLEDTNQNGSDAFHIWHMKATDLQGNVISTGQYGWGENNNGRSWNSSSQTWTYSFVWGTITAQYVQQGNVLNVKVTETNNANSGIIFDGAAIYPLALHFPQLPSGFSNSTYPQVADNVIGPSVTDADYGQGAVASVDPDATKPLFTGYLPTGATNVYAAIIGSTTPDGLPSFQPQHDRPVNPGQTDSFTVSLRFAPSGTTLASFAPDAYQSWNQAWPPQVTWTDHRIIGTVYLASSPQGNPNQPGGPPTNPRNYVTAANAGLDLRTPGGLAQFQSLILQQAQNNVQNLRRLNAQGVITWDIEGEQYPQSTSYVCSPDQIAQAAPEMESVISNHASPYYGLKLDDAYFKIMRDAGFKVGVCIRPQHFTLNADGTASQVYLADADIPWQLYCKIKYAHDRWGAMLFYIDSTVEPDGVTLDPSLFQLAPVALPDSMIIPEETTAKYYAYTTPFKSFLFHTDLGTNPTVYDFYPAAFSANLINDVDPGKLAEYMPQLVNSVKHGDILMVHADYWQANNSTVLEIYQQAANSK